MQKRDESLAKRTLLKQAKEGNVNAAKALQAPSSSKTKAKDKTPDKKDDGFDTLFSGYDKANKGVTSVQ
jgi:hypothetical protein